MLPILLACIIWLPSLIGLGIPVTHLLRRAGGETANSIAIRTAICGLLGMFGASTVTGAVNFLIPAYPLVSSALLLTGWFLMLRHRRAWLRLPSRAWRLAVIVLLVTAFADARGAECYDTGLYHLQSVRWITQSPLPRGLANLFAPLGSNCAWFTVAAALETPLLLGRSCFVLNALLTVLLALPALDSLLRMPRRLLTPDRVLLGLLLIPLIEFNINFAMISSLAPDLVVIMLVLFCAALWVCSPRFAPQIFLLACFAVSIKITALPLLGSAVIAGLLWCRRGITNRRSVLILTSFVLIARSLFLLRSIWLSGCPLYPSTIGRLGQLRWACPPGLATKYSEVTLSWSRYLKTPDRVYPGTPWVAAWIRRFGLSQPMVFAGVVAVSGAAVWIARRPRLSPPARRAACSSAIFVPAIIGWFIALPQIRFGYGYIFGLAALPLAIGATGYVATFSTARCKLITGVAIASLLFTARIDRKFVKARLFSWPQIPLANLSPHRLQTGVTVWKPITGDQVWNTQQLATPSLNQKLRVNRDSSGRISAFWIETAK